MSATFSDQSFSLHGRLARAPVIKSVVWLPLVPVWIKFNTNGAALKSPGVGGCGGVIHNCRAFVKGCFVVPLSHVFAFEAKLIAALLAINYAWKYRTGNQVVGALFKHALGLEVYAWWFSNPSFCSLLVGNDCMG
ncbi:hypothetical protein Dsin_008768 [Dipteronia sinensis]|uniref:RNase H type-1 domain-containing protein n=1 Tax=Dipteronia sinensis TaxID=43782 RepID=A0AAE0APB8_9ROSI|nr:hypothetical protein Dsin_008768 [Dipteronia sinensis]